MAEQSTVTVMCTVHEGGVWTGKNGELESVIERAYHEHADSGAKFRFVWVQLPPGQGWLAGHPSTASTLLVPVPDGISQNARVSMMSAICKGWMELTSCNVDEIIVNAMSQTEAGRYLNVSQTRFDPARAGKLKLKLAARLIKNKLTKGFMTTSINMP